VSRAFRFSNRRLYKIAMDAVSSSAPHSLQSLSL
jgi:hypothetical protein